MHLSEGLSNLPVEILPGNRVIEIRPHGMHKGRIAADLLADLSGDVRVVAIGDDRTDEDLFAALPDDAITLHVGPADVAATRRFLACLLGDDAV